MPEKPYIIGIDMEGALFSSVARMANIMFLQKVDRPAPMIMALVRRTIPG